MSPNINDSLIKIAMTTLLFYSFLFFYTRIFLSRIKHISSNFDGETQKQRQHLQNKSWNLTTLQLINNTQSWSLKFPFLPRTVPFPHIKLDTPILFYIKVILCIRGTSSEVKIGLC